MFNCAILSRLSQILFKDMSILFSYVGILSETTNWHSFIYIKQHCKEEIKLDFS